MTFIKKKWTLERVKTFNEYIDKQILQLPLNSAIAFTDGSYSKSKNKGGYGIVLFVQNNTYLYDRVFRWNTQSHKEILKSHNVGTECEAVKFIIKESINKRLRKITIYYDYEGIEKWITREWNTNTKYTENYVRIIQGYLKQIEVEFIKVKSHIGIRYNELADKLAMNALLKP